MLAGAPDRKHCYDPGGGPCAAPPENRGGGDDSVPLPAVANVPSVAPPRLAADAVRARADDRRRRRASPPSHRGGGNWGICPVPPPERRAQRPRLRRARFARDQRLRAEQPRPRLRLFTYRGPCTRKCDTRSGTRSEPAAQRPAIRRLSID
jgi:hypothetical protein